MIALKLQERPSAQRMKAVLRELCSMFDVCVSVNPYFEI
jgi:hypothetical protein